MRHGSGILSGMTKLNQVTHQIASKNPDALPVYYCNAMVAKTESFSPSPEKPQQVVMSWIAQNFPIDVIAPAPVTCEDLCRAHNPDHVDSILSCQQDNGFGNRDSKVAASLPYTSGSMLAAARHAVKTGDRKSTRLNSSHGGISRMPSSA